ncbi:MAG: amidohydrolase family protein [Clostridia bacterium]|nr:amidohydrolase family protein [Clostridia bacterium]
MKIIDFHTHIYPEKIAQKAVESVGEFYGIGMDGKGTAKDLLKEGKESGVTDYVVHSVALTASRVEAINDYIASECKTHKEFHGFGTMHADFENKIEEIERARKMGLLGVKIHPDTQLFNMDDRRMFELYDYLRQEDIPLLIHCGDYRYDYSHPRRLRRLLREFPGITVIGAHFGGWSMCDLAYEYLAKENCYVDTSSSFWMLGIKRAKELIRLYGAERVVFGSDFPMWSVSEELEKFRSMKLTDEENSLILYKNAEKILKIKEC